MLVLPGGAAHAVRATEPGVLLDDVSLEMNVRIEDPFSTSTTKSFFYWFGFQSDFNENQPYTIFISRTAGQIWAEHSASTCGLCEGPPESQSAAAHTYRIDRVGTLPGGATFFIDDRKVHSVVGDGTRIGVIARNYLATSNIFIDWIRARKLAVPEPAITIGDEVELH
jgi:hypothetical protein